MADVRSLKKVAHIFRVRPHMRGSRAIIQLSGRREVKFNTRTGEVIRP